MYFPLPEGEPAYSPLTWFFFIFKQDYEIQAGKYRLSLDPALTASSAKRLRVTPLQESIQIQVRA